MRYGNNSANNYLPSCGYDSCPCRGVNFISRGGTTPISTDYCVDGRRIRITDGQPLPGRIFIYALNKYADYLRWHSEHKARYELDLPSPFEYTRVDPAFDHLT